MTLLLVAYQMVGGGMPVLGYLCIVLDFVLLPLTFYFNMRRLKRRKDVLAAFVVEHKIPSEPRPGETKKRPGEANARWLHGGICPRCRAFLRTHSFNRGLGRWKQE